MSQERRIKGDREAHLYPRFIGLIGPDGVGKSTHAEIIVRQISSEGLKVRKVWVRGPHTLSFFLSFILVEAGLFKEIINPFGLGRKVPQLGFHPLIKQVWAFIEFLSVLPIIIFKVVLPLRAGYIVVADRYVMDTIITIAYHINDITFTNSKLARSLICLLPRNSLLFHLDADYSSLTTRRGRLVEPLEFIEFQKEGYESLGNIVSSHYIDTSNQSKEETSASILKRIREYHYNQN